MKRTVTFVTAAVVLIALFALATLVYQSRQDEQAAQLAARNRAHLMRMHSPTIGRSDAPVVIVEFFDPACGTCRAFYPLVKDLMALHPDRIRLVLRHAPFHRGSDQVAAMLEAARKQGKFWQAVEALLAAQPAWVQNHTARADLAWKYLDGLGLDLAQMRADMAAPEIARIVGQDLEDARALNVSKTPEFFVNGRPLPSFGFDQLKNLVDEALAKARG